MNLGALGSGALAQLDTRGALDTGAVSLDWFVGADDRWHMPATESSTRQQRVGPAPVVETFVRVPGGDVAHRSFGAAATSGAVAVVEIENRSPTPLTVGLLVRVATRAAVAVDASVMRVDGKPVMVFSRPAGAWAAGPAVVDLVVSGNAQTGPIAPLVGPIELALLFPVPHRTTLRAVIGDVTDGEPTFAPIAARDFPGVDAVVRGWERQLERGLQAEIPPPLGDLVDAARADLLLASTRDPAVVAALEDWGFDDEAVTGWSGLGWRARRRARQRPRDAGDAATLRAADPQREPARFLSALLAALVSERRGAVDLVPVFLPEWLGQSITIDGVPLRAGSLSFAVRWHGARPALLWDAPPGIELRAPALDPAWSSSSPAGEALLAEPPRTLLPMGTHERAAGHAVDAPGQFS